MRSAEPALVLECRGWRCPRPVIELARRISEVPIGAVVEVVADDPAAAPDLAAWCRLRDHRLLSADPPRYRVLRTG